MKATPYSWAKQNKSECRCDPCSSAHHTPEHDIYKIVCNSTCGNLSLTDQFSILEIWKERIVNHNTITISVSNYAINTALIGVLVNRNETSPVDFTVPPGNTLSATVEDAESINVFRIGAGITEGKFDLKVCFPVSFNEKHKKHKYKKC
jgi:hypothetical protein